MDRREAILRELNLYPQWVRRDQPTPVANDPLSVAAAVELTPSVAVEQPLPDAPVAEVMIPAVADIQSPLTHATPDETPGNRASVSEEPGEWSWKELKQRVHDCTACKLRAGCTQTVFGAGDENADWLFVGEGPGADEDVLGEPFMGPGGKLLDNMLQAIKLRRGKNVYIANVIKCNPPGNRAPHVDEITQCRPYLQRQIELIKPKVIVALGKVASNALLGKDETLANLRGKLHDYRGIPLIISYHPAYLLRIPSEKAKAWQDLLLAVDTMLKA